jgi:hypothetical protein
MSIVSPNGKYVLKMQSDGNLVQYDVQTGSSMWHTETYDNRGAYAKLETDRLAIYSRTANLIKSIQTKTSNHYGLLAIQDDGNVVMYGLKGYFWSPPKCSRPPLQTRRPPSP